MNAKRRGSRTIHIAMLLALCCPAGCKETVPPEEPPGQADLLDDAPDLNAADLSGADLAVVDLRPGPDLSAPSTGDPIWARTANVSEVLDVHDVAVDRDGNILVVGGFWGTMSLSALNITSNNKATDAFVLKLKADGSPLWARRYGGDAFEWARGVATDSRGNVIFTGSTTGTVDFGGGPLGGAGEHDGFVVKLSPAGEHLWSKGFGGPKDDRWIRVAIDGNDQIVLGGFFMSDIDLGGGVLKNAGWQDLLLARLDPDGRHLWSKGLGGTSSDFLEDLALDGTGGVVITGGFYSKMDFGGGELAPAGNRNGADIFVARYTSAGAHVFSRRFGGDGSESGWAVALDRAGNVFCTGAFQETADLGGGPLVAAGQADMYLLKLAPGGGHLWSRRFGGGGLDIGTSLAVDSAGSVILTGGFSETVDFGGGPLMSAGAEDAVLAKFSADGAHRFSRRFGNAYHQRGAAVAVDGMDQILLAGMAAGTLDFGHGPVTLSRVGLYLLKRTP